MKQTIQKRYRRLVFFTCFFTFDLILFGAFVRLSDSGLGCPDWPGCYGSLSPIGAAAHIESAFQAMPHGAVSFPKAWIEMIHRYAGTILGLLIISLTWMSWRYRKQLAHPPTLATITLVAVCLQGAFGAWTVTHKLMPIIVTAHLLGGLTVLALMTWLAARETPLPALNINTKRWLPITIIGLFLLVVQIALGGWVSTNYAALACMDFPRCHGQWLPDMDFRSAFTFARPLGFSASGELISQNALTAIHWTHRNFALIVFIYLGSLGLALRKHSGFQFLAFALLVLLGLQFLTGLTTIFLHWPLIVAVLHNGGAAALIIICVTVIVRLHAIHHNTHR